MLTHQDDPPSRPLSRSVPQDAPQSQVRKAFRDISLTAHPDKGGDEKAFIPFQRAYDVLSDPDKREHYDACVEDPGIYWEEYGHYYATKFAPKTPLPFVLVLLLLGSVAVHYAHLRSNYTGNREAFKHAALNGLPVGQGGSKESLDCFNRAKAKLEAGAKKSKGKKSKKVEITPEFEAAVEDVTVEIYREHSIAPPTLQDTFIFSLFSAKAKEAAAGAGDKAKAD